MAAPLAGTTGAALGDSSGAELMGPKRLLERPALLHPTSMLSWSCRLRFRERGPKPLRAVDLMGWENCVIKKWDVAPVSYLFLSPL